MNKKGAEMTVGTIIVIVLALIVLVILIFGFSTGWGTLWDNLKNLIGGGVNVQTIVRACQIACTTNAEYDYCSLPRNVNFGKDSGISGIDASGKISLNCEQLEDPKYRTDLSCPSVTCTAVTAGKTCTEVVVSVKAPGHADWLPQANTDCPVEKKDVTSQVTDTQDKADHQGKKCCAFKKTCVDDFRGQWRDNRQPSAPCEAGETAVSRNTADFYLENKPTTSYCCVRPATTP